MNPTVYTQYHYFMTGRWLVTSSSIRPSCLPLEGGPAASPGKKKGPARSSVFFSSAFVERIWAGLSSWLPEPESHLWVHLFHLRIFHALPRPSIAVVTIMTCGQSPALFPVLHQACGLQAGYYGWIVATSVKLSELGVMELKRIPSQAQVRHNCLARGSHIEI